MPLYKAWEVARENNMDLVEVAATAVPPVCRLLDYGKYKYEQTKKARETKKSQKVSLLREVRLRPKIGDHDFEAKAKTARKLLKEGNKVKITVMFRGREITHPEIGFKLLQRMRETLGEVASIESQPSIHRKRMAMLLSPATVQKAKVKEGANKA